MNDQLKDNLFSSTDCISEQTMFDYIDQKLTAKEQHVVEKHLLDCELCSDAMEGLELIKDRERIAVIDQKVNEYIDSSSKRNKIIGINYRTITAIAAGLFLLIGSIYFFNLFTSDKMMEDKNVAELKETQHIPLPTGDIKPTPEDPSKNENNSIETGVVSESKNNSQQSISRQQENNDDTKRFHASETEGDIIVPPVPQDVVVFNEQADIIVGLADDERSNSKEQKEEEKTTINKNGVPPASSNEKLSEVVIAKGNAKKPVNANRSRAKFKTKERSPLAAYDAPKSTANDDNNDLDGIALNTLSSKNDSIYSNPSELPEFPGGKEELLKFISKNYSYKTLNKEDSLIINTKITVEFIVDKNGTVTLPKIIKGINSEYDKEALRVVNMMPKWKPGKQNGITVPVKYILPIQLDLK